MAVITKIIKTENIGSTLVWAYFYNQNPTR